MNTTRILSQSDISRIAAQVGLDALMDQLIERLEIAFASFGPAKAQIPTREGFFYTQPRPGLLEWMPIHTDGTKALMKMVGYHPENPTAEGLPTILSNFSVYDTTTGHLEAILDGTFLTALRTGAASGVATRLLALPESTTLGVIGCGAQAVTQTHAMMRVLDVTRVLYADVEQEASDSFPARAAVTAPSAEFIEAAVDDITSQSDVICVATSIGIGEGPVFRDLDTLPHLHVNAVGADFPGKFELPKSLLQRSLVTPDCQEQAITEGECQQLAADEIGPKIWELMQAEMDREQVQNSLTIFDSTGWALEDYVATQLVLEHAERLGLGFELELEAVSGDPKDPYEPILGPAAGSSASRVAKAS